MKYASQLVNEAVLTSSRIRRLDLLIAVSSTFALALLSTLARIVLKVRHGCHFGLDDYFIFFSASCLTAGIGIFLAALDSFYLHSALSGDPSLAQHVTPQEFEQLARVDATAHTYAANSILWTSTFCVKLSFLAFFNGIVRALGSSRHLRVYYITTLVVTVLAGVYMIAVPFIACPHFDKDAYKCFKHDFNLIFKALSLLGTALDILTDILISHTLVISIPVLVLRHVHISLHQKLVIGTFLCLSIGMIIIAAVRSVKFPGKVPMMYDAVIMGSLTAFRTVFGAKVGRSKRQQVARWRPSTWGFVAMPRRGELRDARDKTLPEIPKETATRVTSEVSGEGIETGCVDYGSEQQNGVRDRPSSSEFPWVTAPEWVAYGRSRATQ
ncbi:hypothetical protein BU26DRAFT_508888 [Trematosphaeria pertusa]|uniref:Rhodopsin domain-containing protein n=1 Tax=Trematosphaeria pertusa TaxID=390896 RepID=A0A6A6I419_9PLEO|nr:uncharacterized protein BU26DRAFT_508888 [Trematosphaeria pertusa]KAF2244939.1 hypothetical protein BU26DRAFT_508888 [Trematosphaeria pertusa]